MFAGTTLLSHISLSCGVILSYKNEKKRRLRYAGEGLDDYSISIIIPARNEEENLPKLFLALENQSYNRFNIVLVNDRSKDRTAEIMEAFKKKHPERVEIIHVAEYSDFPGMNPKQYALFQGIEGCTSDILLFTDADCVPPPRWVEYTAVHFLEPEVGVVIGPIHTEQKRGFIYRFQVFDHIFRYFYTVASAGMGMPTGGFGNNLATRKKAIDDIGGYGSIGYSVTEDAALIAKIRELNRYGIAATTTRETRVIAAPQAKWRILSKQERRWSYGAFYSPDWKTILGYGAVMLFLFAGLVSIPLSLLFSPLRIIIGSTFTSMLIMACAGGACLRMQFREYWLWLIPSIIWCALFYTFNNILSFINIPIEWKGKKLEKM